MLSLCSLSVGTRTGVCGTHGFAMGDNVSVEELLELLARARLVAQNATARADRLVEEKKEERIARERAEEIVEQERSARERAEEKSDRLEEETKQERSARERAEEIAEQLARRSCASAAARCCCCALILDACRCSVIAEHRILCLSDFV